jgi:hypothetical protein
MAKLTILPAVPALVKPTVDTPFHVDFGWWERKGLDVKVELRAHLCKEHREVFSEYYDTGRIDWVDLKTGEVTQIDGLQHVLQVHCSREPGYISEQISMVDAVFRVFLANGNQPMTCRELGSIVGHPPKKILRTLAGSQIYKGIRPVPTP